MIGILAELLGLGRHSSAIWRNYNKFILCELDTQEGFDKHNKILPDLARMDGKVTFIGLFPKELAEIILEELRNG